MTYEKRENGKTVKVVKNPKSDNMQTILNKKRATISSAQKKRRMS
jgi:hypothetical protein